MTPADAGSSNRTRARTRKHTHRHTEGMVTMSEEAQNARQALQESMDLRDQGHSDD